MNKHVEEILKLSRLEEKEINRRIAMIEKGVMKFSTWEEVKQQIKE